MADAAIAPLDAQGTAVGWTQAAQHPVGHAAANVVGRRTVFLPADTENPAKASASFQHSGAPSPADPAPPRSVTATTAATCGAQRHRSRQWLGMVAAPGQGQQRGEDLVHAVGCDERIDMHSGPRGQLGVDQVDGRVLGLASEPQRRHRVPEAQRPARCGRVGLPPGWPAARIVPGRAQRTFRGRGAPRAGRPAHRICILGGLINACGHGPGGGDGLRRRAQTSRTPRTGARRRPAGDRGPRAGASRRPGRSGDADSAERTGRDPRQGRVGDTRAARLSGIRGSSGSPTSMQRRCAQPCVARRARHAGDAGRHPSTPTARHTAADGPGRHTRAATQERRPTHSPGAAKARGASPGQGLAIRPGRPRLRA